MLSENGEIFPAPKGHVSRLPLFEGPDDRAAELMAFHSQARPLFLGPACRSARVRLSARGSWNLACPTAPRSKSAAATRSCAWPVSPACCRGSSTPTSRRLQRADLRYTNGFALDLGRPFPPLPAARQRQHRPNHESQG